MIKLKNLLKGIEIISLEGNSNIIINGISDNSSKVKKGFLFFAVKGYKIDGHKFIEDAIAKGCIAIICTNKPTRLNKNVCYEYLYRPIKVRSNIYLFAIKTFFSCRYFLQYDHGKNSRFLSFELCNDPKIVHYFYLIHD